MYEGIEDIFRLLDAGRLKEALTQLQGISMQTNRWELRNRIESTLTAYGYMLQYAQQGMEDPNRKSFYQQTFRTAYELTDAVNIALYSQKTSGMYYDRIRTFGLQPTKLTKKEELPVSERAYGQQKKLYLIDFSQKIREVQVLSKVT